MDKSFWLDKWERDDIKFNQDKVNKYLVKYLDQLNLEHGDTVFVPLCGKSIDMLWLLSQGYRVIGVELSQIAVESFFKENKLDYKIGKAGKFAIYFNESIKIYCGDFFKLDKAELSVVRACYDRASLVALPDEMREQYVSHLVNILPNDCVMLLETLTYDDASAIGPPFSVTAQWVDEHYAPHFNVTCLENSDGKIPLRLEKQGVIEVMDNILLLSPVRMK